MLLEDSLKNYLQVNMKRAKECQNTVKFVIDVDSCRKDKTSSSDGYQKVKSPSRPKTPMSPKTEKSTASKHNNEDGDCSRASKPKAAKKPLRTEGKYYTQNDLVRLERSYHPVLASCINPNEQNLTTVGPSKTTVVKRH